MKKSCCNLTRFCCVVNWFFVNLQLLQIDIGCHGVAGTVNILPFILKGAQLQTLSVSNDCKLTVLHTWKLQSRNFVNLQ